MDKTEKFVLPSPNFNKKPIEINPVKTPYLTPCGMNLLSRDKQPPPMYGPRGSTIPPRFLNSRKQQHQQQYHQPQHPQQKKQHQYNKSENVNNEQDGGDRQYCEACEMELQSMDDFRIHKSQHEPCPVDVCKFRGHPSVMDKHVLDLHASGLFDKIKKLSTPEEIAAWREERRKRYPTLANVEMKARAKQQRQQRGERLDENRQRFGHPNDRQRTKNHPKPDKADKQNLNEPKENGRNRNANGNRKQNQSQYNKNNHPNKPNNENASRDVRNYKKFTNCTSRRTDVTENSTKAKEVNLTSAKGSVKSEECLSGIKKFKGTKRMKEYVHVKTKKPKIHNPLTSLLSVYCFSDEDDSEDDNDDAETEESSTDSNCNDLDNVVPIQIQMTETSQSPEINENIPNSKTNDIQDDSAIISGPTEQANSNDLVETTSDIKTNSDLKQSETAVITRKDNENSSSGVNLESSKEISSKRLQPTSETEGKQVSGNCSSDEAPEEAPINRTSTQEPPDLPAAPNVSKEAVKQNASTTTFSRMQRKRKSGLDYRNAKLRKQNTMLEKLLETEIRHERNVLLQCVRFVCQNDFFGIGSKNVTKE